MPRRMTSPVLVGRSGVLQQLHSTLDAGVDGEPRHAVIGGEAGVGKTRLLSRLRELAEEGGARVLLGGCVSMGEEGLPFAPYTEIIRALVAEDGPHRIASMAGRAAKDLARLVPALGPDAPPPEQEIWAQTRLYEALLELFRRLSNRSRIVIQLEDLHWADAGSLAATSFLLRAVQDEPISIIATFRADEVTRKHPLRPWLAEVSRAGGVERLDLLPLKSDDVASLVHNILGEDLPRGDLEDIQLRSDGNPFFVEELLATRAEVGEVLPSSLRDVLLSRVDALPESTQHLLGVAAVGGRVVEHDVLLAAAAEDEDALAADLRSLVDASLLVPTRALDDDDAYAFRHALLQEAVYDAMLPTERRRLHRSWGEFLSAHDSAASSGAAHLLQLAHHWRVARDPRALAATIAAGDAAIDGFSYGIASSEYEEALLLWGEGDTEAVGIDHIELLERMARAAYLASRYRRAVAACREAINELGDSDPARLTELQILLGRTLWVSGDWSASIPEYETALRIAPDDPPIVRIRALAGLGQVYMLHARMHEARPLCEAAIEGARAVGARDLEGHGLNTLGVVLAGLGETKAARESIAAALQIALELGIPDDIGRAYVNKAEIESWCGYPQEALETSKEGMRVAAEWGVANSYGAYLGFGAVSFGFESGAWDEAVAILAQADRMAGPTEGTYVYRSSYVLELLACLGDDDFERLWESTRKLVVERPASDNHGLIYMGGIEHAAFVERYEEAVDIAWQGIDILRGADTGMRLSEVARVAAWPVAELGRAARLADDAVGLARAREHIDQLAQMASAWPQDSVDPGDRLRGILALDARQIEAERARMNGDDSAERWAALADCWLVFGRPFRAAMARWRQAQAAESVADKDGAAGALRDAFGTASELGARPLLGHLDVLARRMRIRLGGPERAAPSTRDAAYGLTRREREVLAQVAVGRTNRQIGAELFISESTAGVHVSNILGKLGVSTRTEAARMALDQGLLDS